MNPLISVIIPAFRSQFFFQALASVSLQTAEVGLEIIVGDDSDNSEIYDIYKDVEKNAAYTIKYIKNCPAKGQVSNFRACLNEATGTFVKLMHDDDVLLDHCLQRQADVLLRYEDLAFVTAHRMTIDALSRVVAPPSQLPFERLSEVSVRVDGPSTLRALGERAVNFIGEPSCVMFRRNEYLALGESPSALLGQNFVGLGDLSLWVNLLGEPPRDFGYVADTLVLYRLHENTESSENKSKGVDFTREFSAAVRGRIGAGWDSPRTTPQKILLTPLS